MLVLSLYEFSLGPLVWRYAGSMDDIVDTNGNRWEAASISHERINQSGEAVADSGRVTASTNLVPSQIWMLSPPSRPMTLRILSVNLEKGFDDYPGGEVLAPVAHDVDVELPQVQYIGEIVQCMMGEPGRVVFDVETISATMSRAGLRLGWQRQCPHAVYDTNTCKADKAAEQIDAVVEEVNGAQVLVEYAGTFLDDRFAGGLLEFTHPVKGEEVLTVEANDDKLLTIFGTTQDLYPGLAIRLFRGCQQTPESCQSFNNYDNYGGVPHMPGKSPFNGVDSPIF